tara:strand:+ start:383 stop:763 length:381 start_codon:yes stop_codon:yes gene_type:complete
MKATTRYSAQQMIEACADNNKGYLYALVDMKEDMSGNGLAVAYSEDKEFYLNNEISYIGMSSNPFQRYQAHKVKKSRKIGMILFNETKSNYPEAELKAMEAEAIFKYSVAKGTPKWQKGSKTFSGA